MSFLVYRAGKREIAGKRVMKKDCFAYMGGVCAALNVRVCEFKSCPFYKTTEQLTKEREKCATRLRVASSTSYRKTNQTIECEGKTYNLNDFALMLATTPRRINSLIKKGYTTREIARHCLNLNEPVYEYNGLEYTVKEIAEFFGINEIFIKRKLKKGITVAKIILQAKERKKKTNEKAVDK